MGRIPSREEILDWLRLNPGLSGRREIARAFGVRGADRVPLKALLREMEAEGLIARERGGRREAAALPPVGVLVVRAADEDGRLLARPLHWEGEGEAPDIAVLPRKGEAAAGPGDRLLARLGPAAPGSLPAWEARVIRRLGAGPARLLGIFRRDPRGGGRIEPVTRGETRDWPVPPGETQHARDGELVEAEALGRPGQGLPRARILARLGDPGAPRAVSLIAIHRHGLPVAFPEAALAEAEAAAAAPAGSEGREDLRDLPLLTIDPADARDRDDAVAALPDPDPANPGGFLLWVAIADVAHYVRPGSALDREALRRGNSTYFPDRVVPMLPEALSGDLCSLRAGADRPCLAVRLVLGADGRKRGHRFCRGLMRSRAALAYEAVQAALDGAEGAVPGEVLPALRSLHACWRAVAVAREERQPLDLDLPERQIALSPGGQVLAVGFRPRLDAHRLIEDFMVLANVAAAEELETRRRPCLYRVHEEPAREKVEALREVAEGCGLAFPKGQVLRTAAFNRLLRAAEGREFAELLHMAVLRTQTQAYYSPRNLGHFGLNLARYAHFTSPIRRYADLVVHRALVALHGWDADGPAPAGAEAEALEATARQVSMTERRSMEAERETADRYVAAFMAERTGEVFAGRVAGVARFGVFVKLDGTGADGLVPVSSLGREYFHFDARSQTLRGEQTGREIGLGQRVAVRLVEASPVTGGLLLELLEAEGRRVPRSPAPRGRGRARPAVRPRRR